ncbi:MAG: Exodeoxyribonuclease VII large subunit (EC [uncultured Campylobacterales bacterium]|uniref:Exodeoxyribonuclease 7 large subunit n=1 Tax=uncultured Campylobacterales bacterium TaxID=352960 RepID=A0A6S6SZD2_9BACT|nr:MAG: Exodeoxyribonuclease VII large subunit (EC [uncultured Campylobacterales bacterium]
MIDTVSELNHKIKGLLETTFLSISVSGEISRPTYHSSGHIYFTLKDNNSSISCVMFKGNNARLKFKLEEGLKVVVNGAISVYTPRGSYQINCVSVEPDGQGSLNLAYEQLKTKLSLKGYFDSNIKKILPKYPKNIVLITSGSGAALADMLRVAKSRWPLVKITLINTLTQGENAKFDIVKNIKLADSLDTDIIVVARGGGSLEDLWSFNEEIVADAIFECNTPVVSAIGHEIDILISDFTADLRAPTPSAAMELILPDINEMRFYLDELTNRYNSVVQNMILKNEAKLSNIKELYRQNSIISKIELNLQIIKYLKTEFKSSLDSIIAKKSSYIKELQYHLKSSTEQILTNKTNKLEFLKETLKHNNPANKSKIGIGYIEKNGKKISLKDIKKNDEFELLDSKVSIKAKRIG